MPSGQARGTWEGLALLRQIVSGHRGQLLAAQLCLMFDTETSPEAVINDK